MKKDLSRRSFLVGSTAVAASTLVTPKAMAANDRMNVGFIGVGGRGGGNLKTMEATNSINVAAICDIDTRYLERVGEKHPQAQRFQDFRKLYDAVGKDLDAVVVSTTEHTHAYATMPALQLGKHVYCEKPLAYNIAETRAITEAAAKAGVTTQMGTQIHATDNYHLSLIHI